MKVTGTAGFGIDTRVPGMLYAAVQMPPMMGGKIANYDDSRAKRMPGVKAIVQYSNGVAVVADSYWNAKKAKDLLVVNYDAGPKKDNQYDRNLEFFRNCIQNARCCIQRSW